MPHIRVNDYDMAFVERRIGAPLLLVHGTLCDYRHWTGQMAPFGARYRTIAPSLRRCWPEQWDGEGDDFTVQQHTADVAGLISALDAGPVHLLGHSRGGHIAFRVAQNFPASIRTLTLVEPGGVLGRGDELRNWGIPIRAQIRFNADFWRVSGGLRCAS
jgi:pimeloyl-ACP methyl ester carboxylesterase